MIKELVYIGKDNAVDLKLSADGVAINLASVSRMVLVDSSCALTIDSTVSPSAFNWSAGDGSVTLLLGGETVPPGSYNFFLIVFDPTNPNGVVWGKIGIIFKSICP